VGVAVAEVAGEDLGVVAVVAVVAVVVEEAVEEAEEEVAAKRQWQHHQSTHLGTD
jgi:hypothetical protein